MVRNMLESLAPDIYGHCSIWTLTTRSCPGGLGHDKTKARGRRRKENARFCLIAVLKLTRSRSCISLDQKTPAGVTWQQVGFLCWTRRVLLWISGEFSTPPIPRSVFRWKFALNFFQFFRFTVSCFLVHISR